MAARRKSALLAQGKERRLDGTGWPWRVRLYAPPAGRLELPDQVQGARRRGRAVEAGPASSQHRGRGAKDLRSGGGGARPRAGSTGQREGASDPHDRSARRRVHRRQQAPRHGAPHDPGSRVSRECARLVGHRPRARREVASRGQPAGSRSSLQDGAFGPRARGRARRPCGHAQVRVASGVAGSPIRSAGRSGDPTILGAAGRDDAVRRPMPAPRDQPGEGDGRRSRRTVRTGGTDPLLTRLPHFGTKIRVAGFGGLRLGEQDGLRAIDVFFGRGYAQVNGRWITPRYSPGFRGPVKNHTLHEVPLPKSLMRDELLPRVKQLLGLPTKATLQQVINAQEAERQRRASLAARERHKSVAWWNYPVALEDELWIFVGTATALPVRPEAHNERWHRVRVWVEENEPGQRLAQDHRLPQPPSPCRYQVVPRRARRALGGRRPIPRRQAHHRPQPLRPPRRGRPTRFRRQTREPVKTASEAVQLQTHVVDDEAPALGVHCEVDAANLVR